MAQDLVARTLYTKAIVVATGAPGVEKHLTPGWYVLTAEADDVYLNPDVSDAGWDHEKEGIFLPENSSITRRLDGSIGHYNKAAAILRIERVEIAEVAR